MTPQASHDAAARRRIRESLDENLIVEASAGTGKTTALVGRIVEVLRRGRARIDEIAAVTFTNKAAGELKLRLREALDKARLESDDGRAELEDALARLEEASIGTIHAFCAQMLRERPVEARVDPAFAELSGPEQTRLYQRAFRAWLERQLAADAPGLRRAFARLAWRDAWDDAPPAEQLQYAGWKLIEWRDHTAPWRREEFAREEELRTLLRLARELAAACAQPRSVMDPLYQGLLPVRQLAERLGRPELAGQALDYDDLEAQILWLGRELREARKSGRGQYGGNVTREELIAARDELQRWIEDFRRRADADLAALLRAEMAPLVAEYDAAKQRQGKLDFVDLLLRTRDLVRDNAQVRSYLQRRFRRIFVDEFQDTDPLQVEILMLLAQDGEPGKLFLVGDPKQSIYKFRRADIQLYERVRDDLTAAGAGLVRLTRSFRSVPNIQDFVNAAFAPEMSGDGHAAYAPLEHHRAAIDGRPSVIALPVPRPYGAARIGKGAVRKSLPDAIAAFVAWLVQESGWGFKESDVAVLFRRRKDAGVDWTRELARGLEARGVAHLLAGSKSFHHREEVETLRAALTAIEWPGDALSVFATLKGSLFAIPDEVLLVNQKRMGRLHPLWREGADPEVARALEILAELHYARNRRPFAATVSALLEATRAHAGFLLRPGGSQVLANVLRVADLARRYEASNGTSFRGFVEELASEAAQEEGEEAPVLEEDSAGVRLMTVHSAKGLEFPVVVLADLTTSLSKAEPDHYVNDERRLFATRLLRCAPWELEDHAAEELARERAEGVRVAYVAATRARDLLVVPAVGDEAFPQDGWLSPLHKALYPARENWRAARAAEGCPAFGQASVVDRPRDYDGQAEASVRPGVVTPQAGTHEVVWWDPFQLALGAEADYGLRQAELLKDDGGRATAAYREWSAARAAAVAAGAAATVEVFLPSEAVEDPPGPAASVEYSPAAPEARPGGRRFGALVHAVLREVALDADADAVQRVARIQARMLGASAEEEAGAAHAVSVALGHAVLARARAAERRHREYPLTAPIEGARVLEGVIDLAFVEDGAWVVVDFKTDADVEARRERYERQLRWYAWALTRLTGMPVARCVLLGV